MQVCCYHGSATAPVTGLYHICTTPLTMKAAMGDFGKMYDWNQAWVKSEGYKKAEAEKHSKMFCRFCGKLNDGRITTAPNI